MLAVPSDSSYPTLSVCLLVSGEESDILPALYSAWLVADEVIVVTLGEARALGGQASACGARVCSLDAFADRSAGRNYAAALARGDWLLFLDGCESFGETAAALVSEAIKAHSVQGFRLPVESWVTDCFGQPANSRTWQLRLYKNGQGAKWRRPLYEEVYHPQWRLPDSIGELPATISRYDGCEWGADCQSHIAHPQEAERIHALCETWRELVLKNEQLLTAYIHSLRCEKPSGKGRPPRARDPGAYYWRGISRMKLGRFSQARRDLFTALEAVEPTDSLYLPLLRGVLQVLCWERRCAKGSAEIRALVEKSGRDPECCLWAGVLQERTGRLAGALRLYAEAEVGLGSRVCDGRERSLLSLTQAKLARLLRYRGQLVEAEALCCAALANSHFNLLAYATLGQICADRGRLAQMYYLAAQTQRRNPTDPASLLLTARVRLMKGDCQGAICDIEHALESDPNDFEAWELLIALLLKEGREEEAARALTQFRRFLPYHPALPTLARSLAALTRREATFTRRGRSAA